MSQVLQNRPRLHLSIEGYGMCAAGGWQRDYLQVGRVQVRVLSGEEGRGSLAVEPDHLDRRMLLDQSFNIIQGSCLSHDLVI